MPVPDRSLTQVLTAYLMRVIRESGIEPHRVEWEAGLTEGTLADYERHPGRHGEANLLEAWLAYHRLAAWGPKTEIAGPGFAGRPYSSSLLLAEGDSPPPTMARALDVTREIFLEEIRAGRLERQVAIAFLEDSLQEVREIEEPPPDDSEVQ